MPSTLIRNQAAREGSHDAPGARGAPLLAPDLRARVKQIQIRTHRLVNTSLSGGYRSTFRGSGLEFSEVRAYQPGDDVRRLDWNVTARTGDPYVKTYAEERELTIQFVVDASLSMDFGSRVRTKRETAAQFCALMSFVALRHQDRVGLTMFGATPGLHLPAKKSGSHVLRVVREVIAAPPEHGGSGFGAVLETVARVSRRRCVLFLVSDFLAQTAPVPGEKDWLQRLRELAQRHDVIAVRVTDPFELDLPQAGLVELVEGETGRVVEVDTRSKAVRDSWRARAAAQRTDLTRLLARSGADILDLDTSKDLGEPILSFFERRAKQHGGAR
jgi:uncharacterized protein (DUF58 family)